MQSTTTLETAESSESLESNESEDRKSLQEDSYSDNDHGIIEGKLRSTSTIIPVDEEYIISEEDVLMGENDEDEGTIVIINFSEITFWAFL